VCVPRRGACLNRGGDSVTICHEIAVPDPAKAEELVRKNVAPYVFQVFKQNFKKPSNVRFWMFFRFLFVVKFITYIFFMF